MILLLHEMVRFTRCTNYIPMVRVIRNCVYVPKHGTYDDDDDDDYLLYAMLARVTCNAKGGIICERRYMFDGQKHPRTPFDTTTRRNKDNGWAGCLNFKNLDSPQGFL